MVKINGNHGYLNAKGIMDISMSRNWQPNKKQSPNHPQDVGDHKGWAGTVKVDTPPLGPVLGLLKFTLIFQCHTSKPIHPQQIKSSKLSLSL